ncbi:MAG TPA: hypothetical protein DCG57_15880, partial [Candidatus Riflebacteria bacterium]|jgi:hypothetical protein|nr:hypothetical protein [Candidatus Riflebacteria bacterium]
MKTKKDKKEEWVWLPSAVCQKTLWHGDLSIEPKASPAPVVFWLAMRMNNCPGRLFFWFQNSPLLWYKEVKSDEDHGNRREFNKCVDAENDRRHGPCGSKSRAVWPFPVTTRR